MGECSDREYSLWSLGKVFEKRDKDKEIELSIGDK